MSGDSGAPVASGGWDARQRAVQILRDARSRRVFSAAAWSFGDCRRTIGRGLIGTLSWGGPPVSESSRWDLASLTKPIVAIAVLSLVESGHLTLDDTVAEHLRDYAGTDKADITVRQLLTHTSGIPGQVPLFRWNRTRHDLLAAIREIPLIGPPGGQVAYSSQGFIVLGLVAEAASGLGLHDLVRERVLAPLSMSDTGFGVPRSLRSDAVATENDPWRGRVVQGEVHDENAAVLESPSGHAGLFTTLSDLESLARALCHPVSVGRRPLLSSGAFKAMVAPATGHLRTRRTLGWQGVDPVGSPGGDVISPSGFGHTGFTGTSLWVDPESGLYSILLTNRVHPTRFGNEIARVRRQLNNVAFACGAQDGSSDPAGGEADASRRGDGTAGGTDQQQFVSGRAVAHFGDDGR